MAEYTFEALLKPLSNESFTAFKRIFKTFSKRLACGYAPLEAAYELLLGEKHRNELTRSEIGTLLGSLLGAQLAKNNSEGTYMKSLKSLLGDEKKPSYDGTAKRYLARLDEIYQAVQTTPRGDGSSVESIVDYLADYTKIFLMIYQVRLITETNSPVATVSYKIKKEVLVPLYLELLGLDRNKFTGLDLKSASQLDTIAVAKKEGGFNAIDRAGKKLNDTSKWYTIVMSWIFFCRLCDEDGIDMTEVCNEL